MNRARISALSILLIGSGFIGSYAFARAKSAATQVHCKDGTLSKKRRGACSHHGGVAGQVSAARATSQGTGGSIMTPDPNPGAIPPLNQTEKGSGTTRANAKARKSTNK